MILFRILQPASKPVVNALVGIDNELAYGLVDQLAAGHIEQCGGGQVDFRDQTFFAHSAVTHRG